MICFPGTPSPYRFSIEAVQELSIPTKFEVIKDKNTQYRIKEKINYIWRKYKNLFLYHNNKKFAIWKALYRLYSAEYNYFAWDKKITEKNWHQLIHALQKIKSLMAPGHKNKLSVSCNKEFIIINIDQERILLPNLYDQVDYNGISKFMENVIEDERKGNLTRLFPLSSSKKNDIPLPRQRLDDLQYIYTNGKKSEENTNKEYKNTDVNEKNKKNQDVSGHYRKEIEQMFLDNVRDCNKNQQIYVNKKHHPPLKKFTGNQLDPDYHRKGIKYIQDSKILQSIIQIDSIEATQVAVIIGHLCQTSTNLTVGTLFNSTERLNKKIRGNSETLECLLQQRRNIIDNHTVYDPENTLISIDKQPNGNILLTSKSCVIPFCKFPDQSADGSIKDGDEYYYPFNLAINYVMRIAPDGTETFQEFSLSFIPLKAEMLNRQIDKKINTNNCIKLISEVLEEYNEKKEQAAIVDIIKKNIALTRKWLSPLE
ncbi:hypothetical protein SK355_04915 [Candidatus Fukatsuia symbiotica]|uniref:Uncharacterized protein n=1 Tax=Candidatus Fukatsuia symbiotica TaxID=1878942 RepID=A0A2U8I5G1_9GAMM|nr:hypothetical protein [Candidatus Fukatsuia symbiotica]AWK14368.1 hypothetical protein CCS41_07590 [Candidatus Fukatsuia symbiotica]MEA9444633.1 hypothetical protein [Candidatus Fukatsuia symbiotica]